MRITPTLLFCLASALATGCATEATDPARDEIVANEGKADNGSDACEQFGWYGDGAICDDFCPQPDSDCDATTVREDAVASLGDDEIADAISLFDRIEAPLSGSGPCTTQSVVIESRVRGFNPARWTVIVDGTAETMESSEIAFAVDLFSRTGVAAVEVDSSTVVSTATLSNRVCGFNPAQWTLDFARSMSSAPLGWTEIPVAVDLFDELNAAVQDDGACTSTTVTLESRTRDFNPSRWTAMVGDEQTELTDDYEAFANRLFNRLGVRSVASDSITQVATATLKSRVCGVIAAKWTATFERK